MQAQIKDIKESLNKQLNDKNLEIEKNQKEKEILDNEYSKKINETKKQIENLQRKLNENDKEKKMNIDEVERLKMELKEKNKEKENLVNELNNTVAQKDSELKNLILERDKLNEENNNKIDLLNQELDGKIKEIDKNQKEKEEIKQKLKELNIEIYTNEKKVKNLQWQLNNKTNEFNQIHSELNQMINRDKIINEFLSSISEKSIKTKIINLFQEHLNYKKVNVDNDIKSALKKNDNFIKKVNEWKDKVIEKIIKEFINETNHINIILLGKTGVGKSTLINALLGKDEAQTGGPFPVTNKNSYYMTEHLRFWDTQGIELSKESNYEKVLENAKNIINDSEKNQIGLYIAFGIAFEGVELKKMNYIVLMN